MRVALAFIFLGMGAFSAEAITVDLVTVGNPGNAPDLRYNLSQRPAGFGAVDHSYQIGKYEVTAGQYTAFLNAVAKADPNALYNVSMADPVDALGANIQRTGSSPNFNYSVAADWADRPVNYVSFYDATRFTNWLHNGQPTGAQGPGTTEDGAYQIQVVRATETLQYQTVSARNVGAKFFIPTEDEWYKAAYHDKTAGLAASYFDYPTRTNVKPGNDITETTIPGNNTNYFIDNEAIGAPYHRTTAGEFELSSSPYGTFDQGGNLWEWTETISLGDNLIRGGSYFRAFFDFQIASYGSTDRERDYENSLVGFRVASVPEPNAIMLASMGCVFIFLRRRKPVPDVRV